VTQRHTVNRCVRIGGDRDASEHHHQICINRGWLEHHLDSGRIVHKCVLQIGAQAPEFVGAAPTLVTHQLQAGRGRQKMPVEQLGCQLASATTGGANNRYVHRFLSLSSVVMLTL
jgi:hypothetical protein